MLPDYLVAVVVGVYLVSFFSLNAFNVQKGIRVRKGDSYAEVDNPRGLPIAMASMGTIAFFIETLGIVMSGFSGDLCPFFRSYRFHLPLESFFHALGLAVMGSGFSVFIWSVVARGRHSVSWAMPEDHALITSGPYRYVRHPSYLGYFLMFIGLPFTMQNVLALIPLMAIPGYNTVAVREEALLVERFGDAYREYKERTGRFLPRILLGA